MFVGISTRRKTVLRWAAPLLFVALWLAYGIALSLAAAPLLDYTRAAAVQLQSPAIYVEQVRATAPTLREP